MPCSSSAEVSASTVPFGVGSITAVWVCAGVRVHVSQYSAFKSSRKQEQLGFWLERYGTRSYLYFLKSFASDFLPRGREMRDQISGSTNHMTNGLDVFFPPSHHSRVSTLHRVRTSGWVMSFTSIHDSLVKHSVEWGRSCLVHTKEKEKSTRRVVSALRAAHRRPPAAHIYVELRILTVRQYRD